MLIKFYLIGNLQAAHYIQENFQSGQACHRVKLYLWGKQSTLGVTRGAKFRSGDGLIKGKHTGFEQFWAQFLALMISSFCEMKDMT